MAQPPVYKLNPNEDIGAPSAPPVDVFHQHGSNEKRALNPSEGYNYPQAGSYNPPYPDPPPPYSPAGVGYSQSTTAGPYAQPPVFGTGTCPQPPPPQQQQQPVAVTHTPQQSGSVVVVPQGATTITPLYTQPAQVVVVGTLTPGTCSVCRRGKIKKSPSCCTWICCILLLPCFIIPGIIAYFCCCQKPKCTHCGYSP
ncbi:hypothetical protein OTU49_011725 [Cherax quadricarinatus]|uniref:Brain protein I3 n=1 Tax=Cherax quadricarinatus TaxID=27406 RepID=A0AAW0Y598_CHEQU